MTYIQVFVTLKVPDNIALTAGHTLQNRMGYRALSSIRRSDFWQLHFPDASAEQARQRCQWLVTRTAFFMNPNKHRWELVVSDRPIEEQQTVESLFQADASVLVQDREDGLAETVSQALPRFFSQEERPQSLQRGVWWDLRFDPRPQENFEALIREIALTTERHKGLLANPHYQTYRSFIRE